MKPDFMKLSFSLILLYFLINLSFAADIDLDGYSFDVPDDFRIISEFSTEKDGVLTVHKDFTNDKGENISLSFLSSEGIRYNLSDYVSYDDVNTAEMAVNGHDGLYWTADGEKYFIYFDDGNLISIKAPSDDCLKNMIC